MRRQPLGRTGLAVSEIGFGAWAIGGNAHGNSYGATSDSTSIDAVQRAVELGVNFFDTADVYGWGHSEEVLGQALKGRREDVLLATKVGGDFYHGGVRMNFDPGYLAFALDRSLQRLQTDHVDLYQLHRVDPATPIEDSVGALADLVKAGKTRFIGLSEAGSSTPDGVPPTNITCTDDDGCMNGSSSSRSACGRDSCSYVDSSMKTTSSPES